MHRISPARHCHPQISRKTAACADRCVQQAEYVVMGCGIIGLACAKHLLETQPSARVIVLEQSHDLLAPSAKRATAAGQGYIWQAHRDHTHAPAWELAARGVALWRQELDACAASEASVQPPGRNGIGRMMHGSLLLSNNHQGASELMRRAEELEQLGLASEWLSPKACMSTEPLIHVASEGGGLKVKSDFHIDAASACKWLVSRCEELGRQRSRFSIKFGVVVNGAVVALGAASGEFIADCFGDQMYRGLLQKRWGLLIQVPYPQSLPQHMQPLQLGVMESSYSKHYNQAHEAGSESETGSSSASLPAGVADVTFTACTGADGQLLLGSSRHDGEASGDVDEAALADAITEHACAHMPALAEHLNASRSDMVFRWGPRPASRRRLPYISAVSGCSGLVVAAGHEGSGLTMALSTAEIVASLLAGCGVPEYADEFAV